MKPAIQSGSVDALNVPTQPQERILSLDVLRAFALLGILLVNIEAFSSGPSGTAADRFANWVLQVLLAGKFHALFSFVFGLGFAIQLERLTRREGPFTRIYLLRLLVLFLFGVLHAVFLNSIDVLQFYAILGVFLLGLRRASDRLILALILFLFLFSHARTFYTIVYPTPRVSHGNPQELMRAAIERGRVSERGTFVEATIIRIENLKRSYSTPVGLWNGIAGFLPPMLFGFYVGRKRYLQNVARHARLIKTTQAWTLAIGLVSAVAYILVLRELEPGRPTSFLSVPAGMLFILGRYGLMLFYAATLVRLSQMDRLARLLNRLSFAGRMPLTNYLVQSLIFTWIFYGYGPGLGYYRQIGLAACMALGLVIFALQVLLSDWWFRHFRFGPLEWLWRRLSYGAVPLTTPSSI